MSELYRAYKEAFRAWLRRRTRPMSIEEAEEKKLFWSRMYAFSGFIFLSYFAYLSFIGEIKLPLREDLPKNVATAALLVKDQPVRFISFRGFSKVEDFTYSKEEMKKLAEGGPLPKPVSQTPNNFTE